MPTKRRHASPVFRFDGVLMAEDSALKGWTAREFALRAGVTDMTVIRFLRGERQTPKSAKKLAGALGYPLRRYLISPRVGASA
jgi:transcriptional regulator with XRE-family HTH domain